MAIELAGKSVFLTGGSRGIGRAILGAMLSKGARVLFCNANADRGREAEEFMKKKYGVDDVIFRQCDVRNADQLKKCFGEAVSTFGAVDICVNNAGLVDEKKWEKAIAVNTTAQIRGSLLALEHMRRDKGGRGGIIVNMSSIAGLMPIYNGPVYCATKHAIKHPKMKEFGVRWHCVCPGPIDTDFHNIVEGHIMDPQVIRDMFSQLMMDPSDFGEEFLKIIQNESTDDVITEVWKGKGVVYRKRLLVDSDGESNKMPVD
ncbi:hypothetical protein BaRGS_00037550 [Batillaria attramentaria]|uniref:15-hydroxyprostaglandin dehydrogenase [NAD(+)] n=1 Tax=Batillaria attramentaria TaxID=370345 RepID=A0ABD0J8T0_9CAEN